MVARYYFAYGTEMWKDQMADRCPGNKPVGKGTLSNWKWIIDFRGYANILPSPGTVVHGLVYLISQADEDSLDAYLPCPEILSKHTKTIQTDTGPIQALVYFDPTRTEVGRANNEYIGQMSNAIEDALNAGVPDDYIKDTIRPFIPKLTFGYGSNLWKGQMHFRCPQSSFAGVGVLENWKWIIMQRHVATVVKSLGDAVYGLLFTLSEADEKTLDEFEGSEYTKCMKRIQVDGGNSYVMALIYIDEGSTEEGTIRPEYIGRLNNGIIDALKDDVPEYYIKKYIRPFVPILYFSYGAHMSCTQMPGMSPRLWSWSELGTLPGWRWEINDDGYANIVPSTKDVVYGMIYEVDQKDEARLDELARPHYTRRLVRIQTSNNDKKYGPRYAHNYVYAVIYVDKRAGSGIPTADYISVMNRAIEEGAGVGLPKKYVDKYIRQHIPPPQSGKDAQSSGWWYRRLWG